VREILLANGSGVPLGTGPYLSLSAMLRIDETYEPPVSIYGFTQAEILRLAASLGKHSEHPLAGAVVQEANARGFELSNVEDFESITGRGVTGIVDGKRVFVGSGSKTTEIESTAHVLSATSEKLKMKGQTVLSVTVDGKTVGLIGVADAVKSSAKGAIASLRRQNIDIVMMTGDSRATADAVAFLDI